MDLTKLSNEDLLALKSGDYSAVSDEGLMELRRLKSPETKARMEAPSGFIRGLRDPLDAAAQLLEKSLPQGAVESINAANQWLIEQGLPLASIGEEGLSGAIESQEKQYQAARTQAGESGVDVERIFGNILSPANIALASKIPQATTLPGRIGVSTAAGGGFGVLQPVTEGDFWEEKAKQAGEGMVGGALIPPVTGGVARVVSPSVSSESQLLIKEGVRPTLGQMKGGAIGRTEEKMMSLPIVGDAITSARLGTIEGLNRAAMNRALTPIGKELPPNINIGRQGVRYVEKELSNAYNRLLPNITGRLDNRLRNEINTIRSMGRTLPPSRERQLSKFLEEDVIRPFTQYGRASGETIKSIESKLGDTIKRYSASTDGDQRAMADALREAQAAIRRMVERVNPKYGEELAAINKGWANYAIIRDAASRRGAKEGVMSPANLGGASRVSDKSVGKGRTAKGEALMQDLTEAGETVLSTQFPNSGTFDRAIMNTALLGAGYIEPSLLAATGAASLPYLPGVRNVMTHMLASRPAAADPIADLIRKLPPFLAPGAVSLGQNILED